MLEPLTHHLMVMIFLSVLFFRQGIINEKLNKIIKKQDEENED